MEKQPLLSALPDSLYFRDNEVGELDTADIWITNSGKKPTNIRFSLRPGSKFSLSTSQKNFTPPGLEAKAILKYKCTEVKSFKEDLIVECPGYQLIVPIYVIPPGPRIVPDATEQNIGNMALNTKSKFIFGITNIGIKDGTFHISCSDESVVFMPKTGILQSNKSCEISGTILPKVAGSYKAEIKIHVDNAPEPTEPISIFGTVVEHSLHLLINKKEAKDIDFGTIFQGQKRITEVEIQNRGPYKRSFVILPPRDVPMSASRSEELQRAPPLKKDQIFTACPAEGTIASNESTKVTFCFLPPQNKEEFYEEETYMHYSSIEVVENDQRIEFQLHGRVVKHSFSINQTDFNFDIAKPMSKQTKTLEITNKSKFLPTSFHLKPIAHFRFEPQDGIIQPGQTKDVSVIFFPKALGTFQSSTSLSFCDGLFKRTLNLSGSTTKDGSPNKKFERINPWEENEEMMFHAQYPVSQHGYDIHELENNVKQRQEYDSWVQGPREERERMEKKRNYERKLREGAEAHLKATLGNYTDEELKEYMDQQRQRDNYEYGFGDDYDSGLPEPNPPLRKRQKANLVLPHPERFGIVSDDGYKSDNDARAKMPQDDTILIKKKFKSKAVTPTEVSETNKALTPAQQLLVTTSHETMNLGSMSVFGVTSRSFSVTNNLQQHILVTMNYEFDELSQSGPISQVIPPKATAGFDIIFSSLKPQNFVKTIRYTINNSHTYSLNIQAQVNPIDIQLSRSTVEFKFAGDSILPIIKEYVTVINKSNAPAKTCWNGVTSPFKINGLYMEIPPLKSVNVEIEYDPANRQHDEQVIQLTVEGGSTRTLKLVGDIGQPKCALTKKTLNFGLLPIGMSKTLLARIKNTGEDDGIFTVSTENNQELTVVPMNGKVSAHDSQTLQVTFNAVQARPFDFQIIISVCGQQPFALNITGQSELPQVEIVNTEFDFGRLFVGSHSQIEGIIKNTGHIPAILFLDLSAHPDFRIEFNTDLSEEKEERNSISLVSDPFFVTKIEPTHTYLSQSSSATSLIPSSSRSEATVTQKGLTYKIEIVEDSYVTFSLVFQPTEPANHSFELPITMMNVMNSNSFHLQPLVTADAIEAPVVMSSSFLDFKVSPLVNDSNPYFRKPMRQVTLFNREPKPVEWRFDTSSPLLRGDKPVFVLEPSSGSLNTAGVEPVIIYFNARAVGPYCIFVPLIATYRGEEQIVGKLQLTGVGTKQVFSVSQPSVCLPIVPLYTKIQYEIYVNNDARIEATLRTQQSTDEAQFPVKITFPKGNVLSRTTERIPLIISFTASRPMSFSTNIAILDENGHATTFCVSATTDASVFTTYPYLLNQKKLNIKSTIEDHMKFASSAELPSRILSTPDFNMLSGTNWDNYVDPLMIKFVQRFFNAMVFTTQVSEFPADLITNQGGSIAEIIKQFQTKVPSNGGISMGRDRNKKKEQDSQEEGERIQTAIDEKASKRIEALRKLITDLRSMGALLASIRPEFLLPRTDFVQAMRGQVIKNLMGLDYIGAPKMESFDQTVLAEYTSSNAFSNALMDRMKVLEGLHDKLSSECWMMVLMQSYKVFILSKVNPERMSTMPGMTECMKSLKNPKGDEMLNLASKRIRESGVSQKEGALLKWASTIALSLNPVPQSVQGDFNCLRDGFALCALLRFYSNALDNSKIVSPEDRANVMQNVGEFAIAIKDLKLGFSPDAAEISDGNVCMQAMTLAYLYETLPHFLPSATVEFQSLLHSTVTKAITVTNPSKSEITYKGTIIGSKNFKMIQESITVGPGKTVDFNVSMIAWTMTPFSGRLTLLPSRPRHVSRGDTTGRLNPAPIYSAPIVVDLVSNVTIEGAEVTETVEAQVYQTKHITIPIKNHIGTPVSLNVYTHISQFKDEIGNDVGSPKPLSQQILAFIGNPLEQAGIEPDRTSFQTVIDYHKPFTISTKLIQFEGPTDEYNLDVEFIPVKAGSFRLLILFIDQEQGEFVYEVVGVATMPPIVDMSSICKLRIEYGKKISAKLPIDIINSPLIHSLAYGIEMRTLISPVSDRKLREDLTRLNRELETLFKSTHLGNKFSVALSSPQYFDVPAEFALSNKSDNALNIVFKPPKAGEYPCKIYLMSECDTRIFSIRGVGVPATKEISLDFNTVVGKSVSQDIPFNNPSSDVWQIKLAADGDPSFNVPARVNVKGGQTGYATISFTPKGVGTYVTNITATNLNKESTVIYHVSATVGEPLAEDRIVVDCQARCESTHKIPIRKLMEGAAEVTCTSDLLKFNPVFFFTGDQMQTFEFKVNATRSGISACTLTFTDPETKAYMWYVVELNVRIPKPEQILDVETAARDPVTVSIPINNTKDRVAHFTVMLSDSDMNGIPDFFIAADSQYNYKLTITPIREMERTSTVLFTSEEEGEYWYQIRLKVTEQEECAIAPLTAPVGQFATTVILLDNPSDVVATFKVENDNPNIFNIKARNQISLAPKERKRVELRYIPSSVGVKESALISFTSPDTGSYKYRVNGIGKPPQPQSPTIVSTVVNVTTSALVIFQNPFPYPTRFSISMTEENGTNSFEFLLKKRTFILNSMEDEFQIPFTFSPNTLGQFSATIVVASLGPARTGIMSVEDTPTVRFVYPVIGNSLAYDVNETKTLRTRSGEPVMTDLVFTLVGETEDFAPAEYLISVTLPPSAEFIRPALMVNASGCTRNGKNVELKVHAQFAPRRPLTCPITIGISNPLRQEWSFRVELVAEVGKTTGRVEVQSLLNKTGTARVPVPVEAEIDGPTPFHSYFTGNSGTEFSLSASHGVLRPAMREFPIQVLFQPKMYGKQFKGMLVIDTMETQFLFEVIGRTPDYVPPSPLRAPIEADLRKRQLSPIRKKNFIRENIISATKIKKPSVTPRITRSFM